MDEKGHPPVPEILSRRKYRVVSTKNSPSKPSLQPQVSPKTYKQKEGNWLEIRMNEVRPAFYRPRFLIHLRGCKWARVQKIACIMQNRQPTRVLENQLQHGLTIHMKGTLGATSSDSPNIYVSLATLKGSNRLWDDWSRMSISNNTSYSR